MVKGNGRFHWFCSIFVMKTRVLTKWELRHVILCNSRQIAPIELGPVFLERSRLSASKLCPDFFSTPRIFFRSRKKKSDNILKIFNTRKMFMKIENFPFEKIFSWCFFHSAWGWSQKDHAKMVPIFENVHGIRFVVWEELFARRVDSFY